MTKTEQKINKILDKIRPYIQMHGGDVHLVSYKKGIATLNVSGACSHCRLADMTYNTLIAGILKQEITGFVRIVISFWFLVVGSPTLINAIH